MFASFAGAPEFRFTFEVMKKMYPGINSSDEYKLSEIADELNLNIKFFQLDTELRRAHFFAQVMQETGASLSVEESFVYKASSLVSTFGYFHSHPAMATALGYASVRPIKADGASVSPEDQVKVANFAYGGRPTLGNGSVESGDGWKYRGRGLKQLTGRANYTKFDAWHSQNISHWSGDSKNFIQNPDLLIEMRYAVRSAVFFWLSNGLYKLADNGANDGVVDSITDVVNFGTNSRQKRKDHFDFLWGHKYLE